MPDAPDPPHSHSRHEASSGRKNGHGTARDAETDFFECVVRYLNDGLGEAELRVLNEELETDPLKQDIFVRACLTQAAVSEELATQYQVFRESLGAPQDRQEQTDRALFAEKVPAPPRTRRMWSRWMAVAAVLGLIALPTALVISARFHSPLPSFATVSDSYHAQWQRGPDSGGRLLPQQEHSLTSGWAEITYTTGTKITLIGPASFTMESPTSLHLRTGRLTATVAGNHFELLTPDARIADLGTEFGVSMLDRTEVAVFSGRVDASAAQNMKDAPHRILTRGDAAAVDAGRVVDDAQQAWPQFFPRRLTSDVNRLNVSDLLAGGDGTTSRVGTALDVSTGKWTFAADALTPASSAGDHAFHKVPQLPVVDGCFIPAGPTPIDSAGHFFDFGATANLSYNQLRVGGIIPWPRDDPHRMVTTLAGIDYAQSPHSLVEFQSNKGITLDLEALRATHPGAVFTEFRAIVGNTFPRHLGGESFVAHTGVYVIVDGQSRVQKPQFSNQDAPLFVSVPLNDGDRFLTIAVSDGGDGINGDWILIGDPEILVATAGVRR
jgi:hypothetical protein